jgi:hypothetical protein
LPVGLLIVLDRRPPHCAVLDVTPHVSNLQDYVNHVFERL